MNLKTIREINRFWISYVHGMADCGVASASSMNEQVPGNSNDSGTPPMLLAVQSLRFRMVTSVSTWYIRSLLPAKQP